MFEYNVLIHKVTAQKVNNLTISLLYVFDIKNQLILPLNISFVNPRPLPIPNPSPVYSIPNSQPMSSKQQV